MDLDNIASGFADNDYSLSGITLQPLVDDDGERSSGSITGFIRKALPDGYGPVDFSNAETLQLNSAEMSLEQNHENLIILTDSVPPVYTQVEIVSTSSINGLDEDSCRTSRKRKFDDGITMTESGFSTTRQQCEVSCSYCDRKLKSESSLRRHVTYVHDLVEEICKVEGCPHVSRTRLEHNTHVKTHKNHERKILRLSEAAKVRTAENVRNELARYYVTLGSRKENATTPDVCE